MSRHLENHIQHPGLRSDNTLHVIGVISNPVRYQSRYRLAREWLEALEQTKCAKTYLVEAAFGDRHHELADGRPEHLRLRTTSEIWLKENMINLGVRHLLPRDWKYVAWVDADVFFRDPMWAQETLQRLQHWPVVQPWQQCLDLGFNGEVLNTHQSFGFLHQKPPTTAKPGVRSPYYGAADGYGHTGYAWACTREFWEQVGGLMDHCVLGSGDHHMARAMVGRVETTIHLGMLESFFRRCREWQSRARRITHDQVSFTHGRIEHMFHGPKKRRWYRERWQLLVEHRFDPDTDLMRDAQGLFRLVGKPDLEQAIRQYNRSRFEDSIEAD